MWFFYLLKSRRREFLIHILKTESCTYDGYLSIFSQNVRPGLAQWGSFPGKEGTYAWGLRCADAWASFSGRDNTGGNISRLCLHPPYRNSQGNEHTATFTWYVNAIKMICLIWKQWSRKKTLLLLIITLPLRQNRASFGLFIEQSRTDKNLNNLMIDTYLKLRYSYLLREKPHIIELNILAHKNINVIKD